MSILGIPTQVAASGSYTAESGSDRVVVFAITTDANTAGVTISSFQFGGVSATLVQLESASEIAAIAYIKEANIPAGSNGFTITYSGGTPDEAEIFCYTLAGRDQTSPLDTSTTGTDTANPSTGSLTSVTAGSDVIATLCGATPSRTVSGVTGDFALTGSVNAGGHSATALHLENATAGTVSYSATYNLSQTVVYAIAAFAPSSSRSITNIDGDNDVQAGQTNITVTTVGMDSAPTVKTATLGGKSLTVVSAGETSWVVSVPLHIDLEWGSTTNDLVLTDDTGSVTLNNVTLSVPAGWETVAFTTAPNPATTESFYEYAQTDTGLGGAGYTMLAGDILAWETQTGLTIDGQTIPQVDPPATISGSYKIFKDATKTWTSVSTFTITDLGFLGTPTITNITNPIISTSSFTIDGLEFGDTQRNTELSQNGVLLSPASWSDTQITANSVDIEASSLSYGNHTFSLDLPASTTTLLPNSNLSNALSGYYPAGDAPVPQAYQVTADNLVTTNTKPVVRGTCTEDGSTLSITVNGRTLDPDVLGGVWRASVSPFSVSRFTYVPYDREPVNQYAAIQGLYNHPDGTIISLYSISAGHVVSNSAFDVYVERSLDKGATWDTATVAPKSGTAYPRGNATYGLSSTGRLFYMSTSRDFEGTPDTIHNVWYTYSDDKGYTWSPLTDIKSSLFTSGMFVAWQSIVETPIGLVAMFYGAYGDNGTFKYSLSTDNGLTWGSLQTICTGYTDWAEPTAIYLGDNKIVLMARAGGSLDANTYLAIKGTITGGTIAWDTPLTPHNAALGATAGSPVSFVQVGSDVIACYSKRAAATPKTYTNRVTASDFWTDPYVIFTQTTYRSEVQEKTAIVGQSNWGYGQLCECRDAGSDSLGEDYTALVAWWEEGPTNTKLEIKMQTVSSVGGAQADVGPLATGVYQVVANGTAADLSTDTSHACMEVE